VSTGGFGVDFVVADDLHPGLNVAKMESCGPQGDGD